MKNILLIMGAVMCTMDAFATTSYMCMPPFNLDASTDDAELNAVYGPMDWATNDIQGIAYCGDAMDAGYDTLGGIFMEQGKHTGYGDTCYCMITYPFITHFIQGETYEQGGDYSLCWLKCASECAEMLQHTDGYLYQTFKSLAGDGPQFGRTNAFSCDNPGSVALAMPNISVSNGACPSGTVEAEELNLPSCEIYSQGACVMYEPANTPRTDTSGSYRYDNEVCQYTP